MKRALKANDGFGVSLNVLQGDAKVQMCFRKLWICGDGFAVLFDRSQFIANVAQHHSESGSRCGIILVNLERGEKAFHSAVVELHVSQKNTETCLVFLIQWVQCDRLSICVNRLLRLPLLNHALGYGG